MHNQSKPDLDVAKFNNDVVSRLESLNQHFEMLGVYLGHLHKAQEKEIIKQDIVAKPGNTIPCNFRVMSVYVDNSANANTLTFTDESGVSFEVAANAQTWFHPLGSRYFDVAGTGNAPVRLVDTFLPIK